MMLPTCKNGHPKTPENIGKNNLCKICKKNRSARYYEKTKDHQKEYSKKWREANPVKVAEYNAQWNKKNRGRKKEINRKCYESNLEKYKYTKTQWRKANPDKVKKQKQRYYAQNMNKHKEWNRNRVINSSKSYVSSLLRVPLIQLSDRLYQLAKDRLLLRRITKAAKKLSGGNEDGHITCNA